MSEYPFQNIETKWQAFWESNKTFRTPSDVDTSKPKYYVLDMFPYPSGVGLHVGHPLGYIATDIVSRYKRMNNFNVLHPMGFDAFGLPAEQFAVEHGVHPRITTEKNIDNMLRQLKALGLSYDWDRKLSTTDVDYYKWTQWIFLKLFNSWYDEEQDKARPIEELVEIFADTRPGWSLLSTAEKEHVLEGYRLAYLAEVPVNWCPALGTVLANEEVTNEGRSERGNYPVYKRPLKQWMLRITSYADRLEEDLEDVNWPEPVKMMQRNWVGRSEGAHVDFVVEGQEDKLRVFTTRPDTLFGATYMVLAPEHDLVDVITKNDQKAAVKAYRKEASGKTDIDRMSESKTKTGVFTGCYAINPAGGSRIPIWIADYVLMGYGTGAIMAVPAQDERDWEFAKVFDLPIVRTVQPPDGFDGKAYTGDGPAINSEFLDGLRIDEAKVRMIDWLEVENHGEGTVTYKLRDWLFSRQRYWGEPFPILRGEDGSVRAVADDELPVELPPMEDFKPTASDDPEAPPRPPLSRAPESWRVVEIDGVKYERELNTMPQWAGSCWYYLRFIDNMNDEAFAATDQEKYWMSPAGVDLYIGGVEHAVLHLLYARFWHKVLFDLGYVSSVEPFGRLFNQGYIQAYAYRDERGIAVEATKVVNQDGRPAMDVQDQKGQTYFYEGQPVSQEYGKMGKSLKNAVSPDEINDQYGCDTLRLYEMYMGPLEASKPWNTRDIVGVNRFLRRVWRNFIQDDTDVILVSDDPATDEQMRLLHKMIARMTSDMERMSFNTAIAALIEFLSGIVSLDTIPRSLAEPFILMLAPLAPHISEEIWQRMGHEESLAYAEWPEVDEKWLVQDMLKLVVQVNGKVRGTIEVPADTSKEAIIEAGRTNEKVIRHLEGKEIRREIYVPGRLINIVVG
ncbi:MAG: leucine--tRNA ligase [Bacteroidetes Order II. Incertae sedis bacterium]|jgi:leucyl-tRNA synthetase|nr:leucine--tRNA ligase [Bacteroidetes Order II. bacterium]MBT6200633.1 leucine--tRNA ligase [Bacteroidetes Order II. bacterium]MBT6598123.1 leucine--tRNA ligase [Bacteroidetes Order II. bacterium]